MSNQFEKIREEVVKHGFEAHQFKVGWYNDVVDKRFHLPYDYNTQAILLLSTPDMFEWNFIPFLKTANWTEDTKDPLDQSIKHYVSRLKQALLSECDVETYYDYEIDPRTKRPRILMPTAGHVSGAAYYYQQSHLLSQDHESKKLYSVSIHPKYGGWFAFRAVLILRDKQLPADQTQVQPIDSVPSDEERLKLLKLFNDHWQDGRYREINNPKHSYSSIQQQYFITPPKERSSVIKQILSQSSSS